MRRVRVGDRRGVAAPIRHVNYGPGAAGTPGAPARGVLIRRIPGVPGFNRGRKVYTQPLPGERSPSHPFRQHTPGYY